MSARAAWRLETLGFSHVYRYTPGKADWAANGLPTEGKAADRPQAGDIARKDVPTCGLTERVANARDRAHAAGWDLCLVVDGNGVVLGRLRDEAFAAPPQENVENVMESGPTTIRPDVLIDSIRSRLSERNIENVLVTTSDGVLIGVLYREDAERQVDAGGTDDEEACLCGP